VGGLEERKKSKPKEDALWDEIRVSLGVWTSRTLSTSPSYINTEDQKTSSRERKKGHSQQNTDPEALRRKKSCVKERVKKIAGQRSGEGETLLVPWCRKGLGNFYRAEVGTVNEEKKKKLTALPEL